MDDEFDDFGDFDAGANGDSFAEFGGNASDGWDEFTSSDVGAGVSATTLDGDFGTAGHSAGEVDDVISTTVALVLRSRDVEGAGNELVERSLALLSDAYPSPPSCTSANDQNDQWQASMFAAPGSQELCETVLKVC
jgi:hypothetical protein